MTPREELLSLGRVESAGVQALYTSVLVTAVGRNFPAPEGSTYWDQDAVWATAHDFLAGPRGLARMTDLAVKSTDDSSFERLLDAAVLNHLRDTARRSDLGRVILRVKEVLKDDDTFEPVAGLPDYWQVRGGAAAPSTRSVQEVGRSLATVQVTVPRWSSTQRHGPLADRSSLVNLLKEALSAAVGSLSSTDLATALTMRLEHRKVPITVELDILEGISEPASPDPGPEEQTEAKMEARDIFDSLSDRARVLVTAVDKPVRELGDMIGTSKSQAAHHRQQLLDKLRGDLESSDDPQGVAQALSALCEDWVRSRTNDAGATSIKSKRTRAGESENVSTSD